MTTGCRSRLSQHYSAWHGIRRYTTHQLVEVGVCQSICLVQRLRQGLQPTLVPFEEDQSALYALDFMVQMHSKACCQLHSGVADIVTPGLPEGTHSNSPNVPLDRSCPGSLMHSRQQLQAGVQWRHTREVETSSEKPAAEAAASSGSNWRGGGVGCRRSSAHAGYAARIACKNGASHISVSLPLWLISEPINSRFVDFKQDTGHWLSEDVLDFYSKDFFYWRPPLTLRLPARR